jgi:hypothetical protein
MKFSKVEKIGFVSTWLILLGYFLIKIGTIDPTGLIYQGINLVGALGIVYVSLRRKAKQTAILNVIWFFIALIAIWRILI